MSDDLIKREDAIEVAYQLRRKPNDDEWDWWLRSFNAIPSADRPQGEWIPCEERLPEADGLYLATFTLIGIPKFSNVESFKNGKWEYHNGYIIAWQPLPKPWKGADYE